jgi:hypothetical protein
VADRADALAAVPRAAYIRHETYAENGEFDAALRMAKAAHDGYVALGKNLEALSTHVVGCLYCSIWDFIGRHSMLVNSFWTA